MLTHTEFFSSMRKTIHDRKPELMAYFGRQVLEDCNAYAREMEGTLRASANSDIDSKAQAVLTWNTPYAAKVYWTGKPRTERNPLASLRWCEAARDKHGKEWREILGALLAKTLMAASSEGGQ